MTTDVENIYADKSNQTETPEPSEEATSSDSPLFLVPESTTKLPTHINMRLIPMSDDGIWMRIADAKAEIGGEPLAIAISTRDLAFLADNQQYVPIDLSILMGVPDVRYDRAWYNYAGLMNSERYENILRRQEEVAKADKPQRDRGTPRHQRVRTQLPAMARRSMGGTEPDLPDVTDIGDDGE
jgi:hypothetical protein